MDEADERHDEPGLAALQVTDEVVVKGVAVHRVLGHQVLGAVLADQTDACVAQRAQMFGGDVFGRHQDADLRRVAPGGGGRLGDAAAHLREALAHDFCLGDVLPDH